jgi:hypothetical protein
VDSGVASAMKQTLPFYVDVVSLGCTAMWSYWDIPRYQMKHPEHQASYLPMEHTSGSVVGVEMSSDNIGGPLAVRVFSVRGGAKLPARARRAESDLDVL